MRAFHRLLSICFTLAASANAQLGNLEPCLPIPSYGQELASYREEITKQNAPPQIHIEKLTFETTHRLPQAIQERIADSLKKRAYDADSEWIEELEKRAFNAWQEHGYFKAAVSAKAQSILSKHEVQEAAVLVVVDEGQQYRLGEISFLHSSVFSNEQLRAAIPLKSSQVFNTAEIRHGFESLRKLYGSKGYINFTAIPEIKINEAEKTISLTIDLDEGKIYRISDIKILGLRKSFADRLLRNSQLTTGNPYNGELVEKFFHDNKSFLPPDAKVESDSQVQRNDLAHTVSLLIDLRRCN